MNQAFLDHLAHDIEDLHKAGLYKDERIITTPQRACIATTAGQVVLNLCANNYLGLADHPALLKTAQAALPRYGFGMSSVRFICGTQTVHKELEKQLADFLGTEDSILYSSCFDANGGLFETLLTDEDAVISDALNHASIIDGIRLCKAKRYRYANSNMAELESKLKEADAAGARFKLIATDGVFSMDGYLAKLPEICDLADKYNALMMVDDSHAVGFMGDGGRGTPEHFGVADRVDIITGTLGKALGGASGGYTAARKEVVDWLRNRSRPYLFSNTLAPVITATSSKVLELLQSDTGKHLRETLFDNAAYFREQMTTLGFELLPGEHPIIPVMLHDAKLAKQFANEMLTAGVYVTSFSFPVVPQGQARIRTQMSSALEREHLDQAIAAFKKVGKKLEVI